MGLIGEEIDVIQRLKMIEKLKNALLSKIADLFYSMSDLEGGEESSVQILADVMMLSYMLGNRIGAQYEVLDLKVLDKLKEELKTIEEDDWGDLVTSLTSYMLSRKNESGLNER